jgi:hypothetical protein
MGLWNLLSAQDPFCTYILPIAGASVFGSKKIVDQAAGTITDHQDGQEKEE